MTDSFPAFFTKATGKPGPYDYQLRLAELPWASRLISVSTGLGKTAAAILAWLWNRQNKVASGSLRGSEAAESSSPTSWPRRLVSAYLR